MCDCYEFRRFQVDKTDDRLNIPPEPTWKFCPWCGKKLEG